MLFVNDIAFVEKSKDGSSSVLSVMRETSHADVGLTNKQTNKLTPWDRILFKNLTVPQAFKKLWLKSGLGQTFTCRNNQAILPQLFFLFTRPMKMEQTQCSETSTQFSDTGLSP